MLERALGHELDLGGIGAAVLLRVVGDQEQDHRQRQDERENAHRVELPAPAHHHDQRRDDQTDQHRSDHGADPPERGGATAFLQREPVGDERERDGIERSLAGAEHDPRPEQLAIAGGDARPEAAQRPDHETERAGPPRANAVDDPSPQRRAGAIGEEQRARQPAELALLAREPELVEEALIVHHDRHVALVEHRDDPDHQQRGRHMGPADTGRGRALQRGCGTRRRHGHVGRLPCPACWSAGRSCSSHRAGVAGNCFRRSIAGASFLDV